MWVTVIHRDGDQLIGSSHNGPVFVHMHPGETVRFHIDDIIDCEYIDEDDEEAAA